MEGKNSVIAKGVALTHSSFCYFQWVFILKVIKLLYNCQYSLHYPLIAAGKGIYFRKPP
jgi:hypothetical protein